MSAKNSLANKQKRRIEREANRAIQDMKQAQHKEMVRLFMEPPTEETGKLQEIGEEDG